MSSDVTVVCKKCGRANRPLARFCSGCGTPLQPTQKPPSPGLTRSGPQEGVEAARKLWEWITTVTTVGARTAWNELVNPQPEAEGQVLEKVKVDSATPPSEPSFFALVGGGFLLLLTALGGNWLVPLSASVATLILSWLRWKRPFFSPLAWKTLTGLWGRSVRVPACYFRLRSGTGEMQIALIGPSDGPEPEDGDRVRVWGVFEDRGKTRMRAWKVERVGAKGPDAATFTVPRLFPFIPVSFFLSLSSFVLAILRMLLRI